MVSLPIYDRSGAEVGKYEIDPAQLAPRISKQLLHDAVVMYQTNQRQGTARTKNRSEVAGTTKKMYRQKGTGNARAGSRRSGIRRGGGHIHAIRPRDWSYRLTKKAVRLATRMAVASKLADNQVTLIDDLGFPAAEDAGDGGDAQGAEDRRRQPVGGGGRHDANVYKSIRNLAGVSMPPVAELNAWSVLRPRRLLMTTAALDALREKAGRRSR